MSLKKEILKNLGLNESKVDFDEEDVLNLKSKFDDIDRRISALKQELNDAIQESADYRTDKGDFLLKGQNEYVRAHQALDKAMMQIRKGTFKGLNKMPTGQPGTYYDSIKRDEE